MGQTLKLHTALAQKTQCLEARWFFVLCSVLAFALTTKWTIEFDTAINSVYRRETGLLDLAPILLPNSTNATLSGSSPPPAITSTSSLTELHPSLVESQQQEKHLQQHSQQKSQPLSQTPHNPMGHPKRARPRRHRTSSLVSTRVVTPNTLHHRPQKAKPRRKPQYGKVLYFLHIHKAGGTFFCNYVLQNHVHASRLYNCNVQPDFYCCGKEDTLEAQIQFANTTQWDLVATERDMYEHMPLDYYTYIVSLRQSKERYYSHWGHLRRIVAKEKGIIDSSWLFANISIQSIPKRNRPDLGNFSEWWAGQPDNWNTRILCGPKCRPQPKYQITRDQFEYTLQRLEKFSFVLFVEDMEGSYDRIASAFNWTRYRDVVRGDFLEKKGNQNHNKKQAEASLALEPWDPSMSALDDALYEFAQRKNKGEEDLWRPFSNQEALDAYFRLGPAQHFTHICGASCTPY